MEEFEEHSAGWFWRTDAEGNILYLSPKIAAQLSPNRDAVGRPLTTLLMTAEGEAVNRRTLAFHLASKIGFADLCVHGTDDAAQLWSMSGRPLLDPLGHPRGFIGLGNDLTEKRRAEIEITRLAHYDELTGLVNRQRMKVELNQALLQTGKTGRPTALFLLDLDRFKAVNDTLGHPAGDALLKQVAQRLQRMLADVIVGRLGGDEFQIVMTGERDRERLAAIATSIIETLSQSYTINGSPVTIGCSVGIALALDDGEDVETLVRNADLALYAAKAAGRGQSAFFKPALLAEAQGRKRLEEDLRHALKGEQLRVVYQPVVSIAEERIAGYEALLRWEHPTLGPISPAEFVPVAEESGLIEQLGEWVLRTATREATTWPETVRIAVNVSPIQFANPQLPALVMSAVAESGIAPQRLELEITESVFLNDAEASARMFAALKGIGVRLALDDFGTGYSSLGYLKSAPFDKIKIDQSFVRGVAAEGSRNAAIIKAIVALAAALGMETTAEGVELMDEIDLIRDFGCTHIQGFVFGRPIAADAVLAQLGGPTKASGHSKTRSPRARVLRRARVELGGTGLWHPVTVRNVSEGGALLEGLERLSPPPETPVTIDLGNGGRLGATVRWKIAEQTGIAFNHRIDPAQFGSARAA
jgi:diguanylate cyclase (GGDEF)-like protein